MHARTSLILATLLLTASLSSAALAQATDDDDDDLFLTAPDPPRLARPAADEPGLLPPVSLVPRRGLQSPVTLSDDPLAGRPWPLWPALVAAGVGAATLTAGVVIVALDGDGADCRGDARDDLINCESVYNTAAAGWTFTTLGVASLATSAVLFYLHWSSFRAEQPAEPGVDGVALAPIKGGGVVGAVVGRF